MPTNPDRSLLDNGREQAARCLVTYLEQVPMPTEQRLEMGLAVLRELPASATPEQALTALHDRLPALDRWAYPPNRPAIVRGHMPAQYLGRPRTGLRGLMTQWGWVLVVLLLLGLTLALHLSL